MKTRPVILREQAMQDVQEAVNHYLDQDAPQAALGFVHALEQALAHIGSHPSTGSPRYAHELNLPGLTAWSLTRYLHMVFYAEHAEHVDVWRVLHGQLDIAAWMREPDGPSNSE